MKRQTIVILTALVLLGAFAIAAVLYQGQQAEQVATLAEEQSELFVPAYAMRKGEATAKVTVVEFFDPACETCAQLAPAVDRLVEDNPGRVQLVERYAPFHPGSEVVVAALEAARRQDRYWDTLALMFATQDQWASHHEPKLDVLSAHLQQSGLDMELLAKDMDDPMVRMIIQQDLQDAKTLGVTKTPEFFVNGKPLPSWGLKQLQDLVQSELEAQY